MKEKHIGFIIGNLDGKGGTERVSTMLANQFVKQGYKVSFLSPRSKGNTFFSLDKKVHVYHLGTIYDWFQKFRLWQYFYWVIRFLIRRNKIDLMIDVDMGTAMYTSPAIKGTKCKEITWDHFNYTINASDRARQKGLAAALQTSSKLVLLTKADRNMYLKQMPNVSPDFFTQIYNPVTFDISTPIPHSEKRVIAVGRYTKQKGFDYLLDIWQLVEKRNSDWILEIIGDGEDKDSLINLVQVKGLCHVTFSPPTNDIYKKLSASSIYVLPSRYEGFPMVLLEATAMSLPIVAFDCPTGPSEIVENGVNGFLIPPFEKDKFADKLDIMMQDDELRGKMGIESFRVSRKFSIEKIFCQWERLIDAL